MADDTPPPRPPASPPPQPPPAGPPSSSRRGRRPGAGETGSDGRGSGAGAPRSRRGGGPGADGPGTNGRGGEPGGPGRPTSGTWLALPGDPPWPPLDHPHNAGDPDEAFKPGFTMLDALAMLVWGIVGQVLVVAVAAGVGVDLESTRATATLTIVMQLVVLLGIIWFMRYRRVSLWRVLGPVRPRWRHLPIGVGLGLVGVLLVLVVSAMITAAFPDVEQPSQALLEILGTDVITTLAVVMAAAVMAPLVEEVQYRSLLFQSVRAKVGLPGAMVLSALVFVGAHVEVWGSLPALGGLLVLALWLAAIFHQTGTLVVAMVAHGTFNAVMIGLALALPQDIPGV